MAIKVSRKKLTFKERLYLPAIGQGMAVTLKHFLKSAVGISPTIQYPEKRRPIAPGFRGHQQLKCWENGVERCVACEMCSTVCPSDAITIVAEDTGDPNNEKRPGYYHIDMLRCIFCGMCVEACPKDAITMTKLYELADNQRDKFIAKKDLLKTIKDKE